MVSRKVVSVLVIVILMASSAAVILVHNSGNGDDPLRNTSAEAYRFYAYDHATGDNVQLPAYYDDSFFDAPSTEYNPDLMLFALCLELSCGYHPEDGTERYASVVGLMKDIGCKDVIVNEYYSKEATMTSTEMAIGQKQLDDRTVIFLALNGARYSSEFASNIMIGSEGDHQGFAISRDDSLEFLRSYIREKDITGDTAILVTGYSRTSAASNLVAAYISDAVADGAVTERIGDVNLTRESVYGFGFSVPFCANFEGLDGQTSPDDERYDNIWYTINPSDLVVKLPIQSYGFERYGHKIVLPVYDDAANRRMLANIGYYLGEDEIDLYDTSSFKNNVKADIRTMEDMYNGFVVKFFAAVGTREYYAENLQDDLSKSLYLVLSHEGVIRQIIDEMGGIMYFAIGMYNHYGQDDFDEFFLKYVRPVCERNGYPEYAEAIVDSMRMLADVVVEYCGGSIGGLISDPYLSCMLINYDLLFVPHYPIMTMCYLMEQSSYYLPQTSHL